MSALVLHVRLADGRYHGNGNWPPSPARLFQALVAGAGLGGPIGGPEKQALEWLERQKPPLVATPAAKKAERGVLLYMPNNDSDRVKGDPLRIGEIRTATKVFRPYLFDAAIPLIYAWLLHGEPEDENHAKTICALAERLYQFGRGVDMAWAWGELLGDPELERLLAEYQGQLFHPSAGMGTVILPCPCPGSLQSLDLRHRAFGERFRYVKQGRSVRVVFRRPPQPRFQVVSYNSPPSRRLYELRDLAQRAAFVPWPLVRAFALVVRLRDGVVERLKRALPARTADVERVLVGRRPDGTNDIPPGDRVRIVPLPSIGHFHADREIRRVLIEVPGTCPLRADDVFWAFSGLEVTHIATGEAESVLTRAENEGILFHYGINGNEKHSTWRTVTPAVLPEHAARRRIDPSRKREEAKHGAERFGEIQRAASAVRHALRHAGVRAEVEALRVQREPFEGSGSRVETFAEGTRFAKERLWHVEITFREAVSGPLVIGDGRFFGLGLMAPVARSACGHPVP